MIRVPNKPVYANTIHIYGMLVRTGKRGKRANRDYQDPKTIPTGGAPTFTYHVSDEVTIDDVAYYLESKKHVRVAPVDGEGQKLETTIGMDRGRPHYMGEKVYNRIELFRQIDKDIGGVSWVNPSKSGKEDATEE